MAANSMTGFARAAGASGTWRWAFEVKSVNAKGLDLRLRMPPPFDRVGGGGARAARQGARARDLLRHPHRPARGQRQRAAHRRGGARRARRRRARRGREGRPRAADHGRPSRRPRRGGGRRGRGRRGGRRRSLRRRACEPRRGARRAHRAPGGRRARRSTAVLQERLDAIEALTLAADANPARKPEAVRARLAESVAALMESGARLRREPAAPGGDPARLQGRHPRGARPAEDPRRRRPRASRRGRGDRPAARLPRPGVFAGGEHALRQGQRREPDRPGA